MKNWYQSQRGYFAGALYEQMGKNKDIWLIDGDVGFGMFNKIKDKFPERYLNVGAAEQAAVAIAVGLAEEGKIPFVYIFTAFMLRAAETISLYLDGEQANVKLVGSGRNNDYKIDNGVSHVPYAAQKFLKALGINKLWPKEKEEVPKLVKKMIKNNKPYFLSLKRLI